MLRQRERFERSDVPTPSPLRNVVAVIVLVVVAMGLAALVSMLWHRAQQVAGLGNRALRTAVRSQSGSAPTPEGYTPSEDSFADYLFFVTGDDGGLVQTQFLTINETAGTGVLAEVPLNLKVSTSAGVTELAALYAEGGAAACVGPLSSSLGIRARHALVVGVDFWEQQVDQLRGSGLVALLGSTADAMEGVASDMSTSELLEFAETLRTLGVDNLARIDVVTYDEQLEDGRVAKATDQNRLLIGLGLVVHID